MEFNYNYKGSSSVSGQGDRTAMSFSPDVTRQPTYFRGELHQNIAFREAISALHDVVVSDLRFKPKDKEAYKAWAAQRNEIDWQLVATQRQEVTDRIKALQADLTDLNRRSSERMSGFYRATARYFDYLYQKDRDYWFVLDPVITVHPDEVFFECFSQDESSYGRLGASYEVFKNIDEFACGTTNIDYSAALYDEFQKIRSYKRTLLEVDPSGFEVQTTGEADYKEVKIDLPDTWVRGFLQVSSAMSLPAIRFDLHPTDIYNICFVLRRRKEKQGPRSMRYILKPNEPIRIVFEPWGTEIVCSRSIYEGNSDRTIRVWGRRRLLILERLIPVARKFTVHLLGNGMPSFYVADLEDMSFTLGLSGWTANDWAKASNFDLLAPRANVDDRTKHQIFEALKQNWVESPDALAARLRLDRSVVLGALSAYTQAGSAIYDLNKQVYRVRELSNVPLPMDKLRFASDREAQASQFLEQNAVRITSDNIDTSGTQFLQGEVRHKNQTFLPVVTLDRDLRIVHAECTCNWHQQNKLFKGPCEHILALRMHSDRIANAIV
ncbi:MULTISPECIES: SWIM zinc finger family protein [Pseudanabaena]|uniref:SWIM zinc finger domain-containing protein n=2 Tax=Pseudanabaena TaxID=1152 RepID=L8MY83_9CYAN|nr:MULTISPECIES: SWIM zinc finger family protein [Pseudanabaena]ELS32441.1 SWIM zinc finger domain-containing protein [Pseudanabaena biceps PCC 7429]MDG3495332.1 SWIM zinc finger domain-containing protein [Pseudanabaena catenata USMAC16]